MFKSLSVLNPFLNLTRLQITYFIYVPIPWSLLTCSWSLIDHLLENCCKNVLYL